MNKYIVGVTAFLVVACVAQVSRAAEETGEACVTLKEQKIFNGLAAITDAHVVETAAHAQYCVARAKFADSELQVEARLPLSGWNAKLVYLGGGGFNGAIAAFPTETRFFSPSALDEHYAVVASNGGYDGPKITEDAYFKAAFAQDAVKLADFMFQSDHRALPIGKEIVRLFYGEVPRENYFEGCSTGGHEALMEAQRYPDDFDGVVARAPAGNFVGLYTQFHRIAQAVRTPGGNLSPAKRALLAKAVLARCDAADGLADGIISKPGCTFDPKTLRCPDGKDTGETCLSDGQIATVLTVTTAYASRDGSVTHAGYNYGAEDSPDGWGSYIWPSDLVHGDTVQGAFSDTFIRAFVTRDPAFDTSRWDPNDWLPVLHLIDALFQAIEADLSRFAARKGKLIIWNGMADSSVSPRESTQYYERAVKTMGQQRADQTLEMFLAPGVGHCNGGIGPDRVDLLKAVSAWVEKGTPPSQQGLTLEKHDASGAVVMTRPLCRYPRYPRYTGRGDANRSASFVCADG